MHAPFNLFAPFSSTLGGSENITKHNAKNYTRMSKRKCTNLKTPSVFLRMSEISSVVYKAFHRLAANWDLPTWPPRISAGFIF